MRPGVHERKWEPDSLLAFCRLSAGYCEAPAGSLRPFDAGWRARWSRPFGPAHRAATRWRQPVPVPPRRTAIPTDDVPNLGRGASSRPNGMVHGAFRPSDDASALPLNVPVNLALAAALDAVAPLAAAADASASSVAAGALASEIRDGVATDGLVRHGRETIWAYEVDGLGGRILMDDANAPSLLVAAVPRGVPEADPVYLATRRWVLSPDNPWWFHGRPARASGSPHTGPGLALAHRGRHARSHRRRTRRSVWRRSGSSARRHAGTFLAHESFDVEDPARFTRPWFAWANTLVGELLERAALDGSLA